MGYGNDNAPGLSVPTMAGQLRQQAAEIERLKAERTKALNSHGNETQSLLAEIEKLKAMNWMLGRVHLENDTLRARVEEVEAKLKVHHINYSDYCELEKERDHYHSEYHATLTREDVLKARVEELEGSYGKELLEAQYGKLVISKERDELRTKNERLSEQLDYVNELHTQLLYEVTEKAETIHQLRAELEADRVSYKDLYADREKLRALRVRDEKLIEDLTAQLEATQKNKDGWQKWYQHSLKLEQQLESLKPKPLITTSRAQYRHSTGITEIEFTFEDDQAVDVKLIK